MKFRKGFVSNSSSSSYVVLIPDSFDIDAIDFIKYGKVVDDYETTKEEVITAYKKLMGDGEFWDEDGYNEKCVLREVLKDFIIATLEASADSGQIVIADKEKVKNLLK